MCSQRNKQARKLNLQSQYYPSGLFSHKGQKPFIKRNGRSKIMKSNVPIALKNIDPDVTKLKLPLCLGITSILQNLKMQGRHVIHTQLNY